MVKIKSVLLSEGSNSGQVIADQNMAIGLDTGSPALFMRRHAFRKLQTALGLVLQSSKAP